MIGCQQDPRPGIQRRQEPISTYASIGGNSEILAKVVREVPLNDLRPERAETRRDEAIRLGNNDVLHCYVRAFVLCLWYQENWRMVFILWKTKGRERLRG